VLGQSQVAAKAKLAAAASSDNPFAGIDFEAAKEQITGAGLPKRALWLCARLKHHALVKRNNVHHALR